MRCNAWGELVKHTNAISSPVVYVEIRFEDGYDDEPVFIAGKLEQVQEALEQIEYHSGHGHQYLSGTIWYKDGTWSERGEYDGAEWWEHRRRPELPEGVVL